MLVVNTVGTADRAMNDGGTAAIFAAFWALYPRKVCRLAAEKAFTKALKLAEFDTIMCGLKAYEFSPNPRFQPHAATWLNRGGWHLENDTPAPTTGPDGPKTATALWAERLGFGKLVDNGFDIEGFVE